ncbi:MarR family winged helix-turn-helix transcriptional regulator [Actinoallomurus iriomotensis]|uniref:MarR family winged helix-turn-helix transcriptional regulator n=1 Tax=Actinoallomurus iriomotensis TaxID=478107 RepID=UPI00255756B8|nr:MarR family winged helix-turn-helix transcriptional regulator [Actinoallomurus iriomotensis]
MSWWRSWWFLAIPTEDVGRRSTSHRSVLVVASEIREHPGISVGEIATRTGFPQSKVSACVARLREAGAIVTATDPADRRRLLIHPAPEASTRVAEIRAVSVDRAIGTALGTDDPERVAEVVNALRLLADRLSPTAH